MFPRFSMIYDIGQFNISEEIEKKTHILLVFLMRFHESFFFFNNDYFICFSQIKELPMIFPPHPPPPLSACMHIFVIFVILPDSSKLEINQCLLNFLLKIYTVKKSTSSNCCFPNSFISYLLIDTLGIREFRSIQNCAPIVYHL